MKHNLMFGIPTTLMLLLLISAPNTYAQTTMRVTVPFNFTVEKAEMPAGTYTISRVLSSVLEITDSNARKSVLIIVRSEGASSSDASPKLVFNQYGDRYFLSQVSRGYGADVMQLRTSKLEEELRLAGTSGAPGQQVVAAKVQK